MMTCGRQALLLKSLSLSTLFQKGVVSESKGYREGSSAPDTQGKNPRETPTKTNLKRKYVHELKTGNTNIFFYNCDNRNWS